MRFFAVRENYILAGIIIAPLFAVGIGVIDWAAAAPCPNGASLTAQLPIHIELREPANPEPAPGTECNAITVKGLNVKQPMDWAYLDPTGAVSDAVNISNAGADLLICIASDPFTGNASQNDCPLVVPIGDVIKFAEDADKGLKEDLVADLKPTGQIHIVFFSDGLSTGGVTSDMADISVPEPCSLLLLGSGLVGLVGYGWRRRRITRPRRLLLWHRLLRRPVSESGRLRRGNEAHWQGDRRRKGDRVDYAL